MDINCCSVCSVYSGNGIVIDMYYSKLKQSNMNNKYICYNCYKQTTEQEEQFIQSNIDNIKSIIKNRYLEEYVKPEPEAEPEAEAEAEPYATPDATPDAKQIIDTTNIKIYKFVKKMVNGVERDMVLIDFNDFKSITGINISFSNAELLHLQEQEREEQNKRIEREKKAEEIENKRIREIEQREQNDKLRELKPILIENKRIEIAKSQREINQRRKQELLDEYKHIPNAEIMQCSKCKENKIYPVHFINDDDKAYEIYYTKYDRDGSRCSAVMDCCCDCYNIYQEKKEKIKDANTGYCEICKSYYNATSGTAELKHFNSSKHLKHLELAKIKEKAEVVATATDQKRMNLSKLSIRELYKICSKSLDNSNMLIISNYKKLLKNELLEKMNEKYNFLVLV